MSYTEIYAIQKDGVATWIGETKNAYRGAMAVWSFLADKYIDKSVVPEYLGAYGVMSAMFVMNNLEPLWALHKDTRLSDAECIYLLSTFDNVLVELAHIQRLLAAFREVAQAVEHCSLIEQADIIDAYLNTHDDVIGIGWNQTSVNADVFSGYEDAAGKWIDYNINDNPKHWWLFADFDTRQTTEGETR